MFGKKSNMELDASERAELDAHRKAASERMVAEQLVEAKAQQEKWDKRKWQREGDTEVTSLAITGGRLLRVDGRVYFMPTTYSTNYAYAGSGIYNVGSALTNCQQIYPL
jgi:hypothetical protein